MWLLTMYPENFNPLPHLGAFDIPVPYVYSRYDKIGVYMEGLYLRKWGAKHICFIR
jgi:hypothetical protein